MYRLVACLLAGVILAAAPAAAGAQERKQPGLEWQSCGTAAGVECTTVAAPMDYDRPRGDQVQLFVARTHATGERTGVLFFNFGGPGGTAADAVEGAGTDIFPPALTEHFDIIGMDPRGVGQSTPSLDCHADQETEGIYSQPFTTPFNLNARALLNKDSRYINKCLRNGEILAHLSTANVARDMDLIRDKLGEKQLNYLGFSYGTFLGATYASLFPRNYRAMVLDGPVDATNYINDPMQDLSEQSQGFERGLSRFFQACAANQAACQGFGAATADRPEIDPNDEFDLLVDRLNQTPLVADGRPVDGDDVLAGAAIALYNKGNWPILALALARADQGDGSVMRFLADAFYGRNDDGTYDPASDRYFLIGAAEQRYARDVGTYLEAGDRAWGEEAHTYWNNGYTELNYGLWPVHDRDAFAGPFRVRNSAATPLVVAMTYDVATPYRGAQRLVRDLGNARLLTMRGDGHTSYGAGSPCVDSAIESYLTTTALPPAGTVCRQNVPFASEQTVRARALAAPQIAEIGHRPILR